MQWSRSSKRWSRNPLVGNKKIAIIGGSMAGLFAAIGLRAKGFEVNVYERAGGALANRGAGIATHHELYDAVRAAGVDLRDEMGVRSRGRIMLNAEGQEIHRHELEQVMTSWGLIYRFLRAQLEDSEYHLDHDLVGLRQNKGKVTARFANGKELESDWLIAADGARSTVRSLVAPEIVPQYVGYFGWRGLIEEAQIPDAVLQQISERITFGMAPTGHWLGYLVAGPNDELEVGKRWYNWGWYQTANADAMRDHLTDATGHHHANGIPHDLIREELVNAMRKRARDHLAPQIQAVITATAKPFLQGMIDFGCQRLIYDRVAIIGDAAFTARPHVGLGVSKAAEDASTLASALAANDQDSALRSWQAERVKYGAAILQWGRDLGSYLGPQASDAAHRQKAEYYQRPETLTSVTATNDPRQYLNL